MRPVVAPAPEGRGGVRGEGWGLCEEVGEEKRGSKRIRWALRDGDVSAGSEDQRQGRYNMGADHGPIARILVQCSALPLATV